MSRAAPNVGPVLVSGAYGLIGHAATLALRDAGAEVVATDLLAVPPSDAQFHALPLEIRGVDALSRALAERRIDAVVHTAGVSGPMLGQDAPHRVFETNIVGTLDLFEASRRAGVRRVVVLSSASAYGETRDEPISETTPLGAVDVYGASKVAGELIARAYCASHGVEVVILRPCWVYGARRRTPCVLRTMVADGIAGRSTHMPFGAGFPRQFVHVDDVARAIVAAVGTPGISGMAFNLSDGSRRPLEAVARLIEAMLPAAQITMERGPDPDDVFLGPLDISAARARLSWSPAIRLEDGVRDYIRE